jgi:hypothetical protein
LINSAIKICEASALSRAEMDAYEQAQDEARLKLQIWIKEKTLLQMQKTL